MVFTQQFEGQECDEEGLLNWTKNVTLVNNQIKKTKTIYFDPKGNQYTYFEVKKMLSGRNAKAPKIQSAVKKETALAVSLDSKTLNNPKKATSTKVLLN